MQLPNKNSIWCATKAQLTTPHLNRRLDKELRTYRVCILSGHGNGSWEVVVHLVDILVRDLMQQVVAVVEHEFLVRLRTMRLTVKSGQATQYQRASAITKTTKCLTSVNTPGISSGSMLMPALVSQLTDRYISGSRINSCGPTKERFERRPQNSTRNKNNNRHFTWFANTTKKHLTCCWKVTSTSA